MNKIIQVANIAPQTTKEQMQTLFGFIGKIDDIRLYPTIDLAMQVTCKICFIKFHDSSNVSTAQHLTNTVFIDRALVIIPFMESEIPDEQRGLELLTSGTLLPGIADPKLPQHVTSQLEGFPPHQVVGTYDPKLAEAHLPMYPPLPNNYDGRKIEEIRRTVLVANTDKELSPQIILDHFNQCGEVKYFRLCTRDNDPLGYALIEFTEQPSLLEALKQNGVPLGSQAIKVYHATQAIVKPQAKTNEAAQKEIEEAMSRQAQTILSQGIDSMTNATTPHLGAPVIKEKRRSRSRHRSRDRRRSGSRGKRRRSSSRRRVDNRYRSRSRERVSRRRSRSRDHYKRRSYSRSPSRSRKSRSRSSKREDKKKSSTKKHKERKKDREKDREKDDKRERDRGKDEKRDRDEKREKDRDEKRDNGKDKEEKRREDRKEKNGRREEKDRSKDREKEDKVREKERIKEEVSQNGKE